MPFVPARLVVPALALFIASGCAGRFRPPEGPAAPAADGPATWAEAVAGCDALTSVRAELSLSGRAGSRRIPGLASARVGLAVTAAGAIAMEARVSGQLAFKLAGTGDRATLLLASEGRVVNAPAGEILDALVGVDFGPERLLAMLNGCPLAEGAPTAVERIGNLVRAALPGSVAYLTREAQEWRVRAVTVDGFLVDYQRANDEGPQRIGLYSESGREPAVALTLGVEDLERNPVLPASIFTVVVPEGTQPLAIEELRAARPDASR